MVDNTYIKLYRKSLKNALFNEKPFDRWHAFEWMLLSAHRFPKDEIIKGQVVHFETGQLLISVRYLADVFGWSAGKVRRFVDLLVNQKIVSVSDTPCRHAIGTLITIENYTRYQFDEHTDRHTDEHTDRHTDEHTDRHKIKKDKKDKKDKKVNNNIFRAPAREEVVAYCMERGNDVDVDTFIDFYKSNGWMVGKNKMKDWRAAVRNWERKSASKSVQQKQEGRLDWIDNIDI